jgi:hypothetical protein
MAEFAMLISDSLNQSQVHCGAAFKFYRSSKPVIMRINTRNYCEK